MSTEARLSVLEMMMAEAFARLFTSDDEMRSWTERTAEQVRRQAEAREKDNPAISAAYKSGLGCNARQRARAARLSTLAAARLILDSRSSAAPCKTLSKVSPVIMRLSFGVGVLDKMRLQSPRLRSLRALSACNSDRADAALFPNLTRLVAPCLL